MGVAVNLYLFSRAALARGVAGEGDHHAFAVERNPPVGIERPDVRRMPLAFVLLLFDQFADLFVRHALVGGAGPQMVRYTLVASLGVHCIASLTSPVAQSADASAT